MAELTPQDRLQPALLDRLTDDEPGSKVESRERRVVSVRQLRASVLRDLGWLLNTTPLGQLEDLSDVPEAEASVINFGLPDLAGVTLSGLDPGELERRIREAIRRYEPRILPRTLKVRAVMPDDAPHKNALAFEIEGELWGQPMPTRLYLKSEIDLEDGTMTVIDRADSGPV
jgi:type VI secretion system protein ImpF